MTRGTPAPEAELQRRYRARIALFLFGVVLTVAAMAVISQTVQTIRRLETVEADRDRWQRPREIIDELRLKDGGVVVDLGCGAGYFALKLADVVGRHGRVLAVDTRWSPLLFLQARAFLRGRHNLSVIHGEPEHPHLSGVAMDAGLIVNTYHELADRESILNQLFSALVSGGRLVIVDRGPGADAEPDEGGAHRHQFSPAIAETELRSRGFGIVTRQDHFAGGPGHDRWWILVAAKP